MMAINRYRLKALAKTNKSAKRTEKLLGDIDHLIGTILLGNNFVNIFASSIATVLAIKLWGEGSVVYASIVLTFVILIFAETTPKTFAAKNPEKIALPASGVIRLLIILFKPFVWVIAKLSSVILWLFGVRNVNVEEEISSEELKMVVHEAKPIIASNYQKMLLNIIDLEKVKVEDIMIPRLGAEYRFGESFSVLGGFSYRPTALKSTQTVDVNLFDTDRYVVGVGISAKVGKQMFLAHPLQIDLGYQRQELVDRDFTIVNSRPGTANNIEVTTGGSVDVFSGSISLKF